MVTATMKLKDACSLEEKLSDDLSPKKVKVVVGVSRKHSDNEAESIADALSSTSNILASEFFEEEKQESPKSTFSPAPR